MTLYDENMPSAYSAKIKKGFLICFLPLGFSLLVCVGLCFLIDKDNGNATLIHVINVIVTVLSGWLSISALFGYVLPCVRRRKITEKILSSERKQVRGKVVSTDNSFTLREGLTVTEIQTEIDGKIFSFYYDNALIKPQFSVGDVVKMTIADNFVFAYEVEDHEEEN